MIYVYRCPKCKTLYELTRLVADRDNPAPCPQCEQEGDRLLTGPSQAYVTGAGSKFPCWVRNLPGEPFYCKNKRQFREACKKHDCYPAYL